MNTSDNGDRRDAMITDAVSRLADSYRPCLTADRLAAAQDRRRHTHAAALGVAVVVAVVAVASALATTLGPYGSQHPVAATETSAPPTSVAVTAASPAPTLAVTAAPEPTATAAAQTTTPTAAPSTTVATPTTTVRTTALVPASVTLPWDGRAVGGVAAHAVPILGTATSLYAGDDDHLFRIDPTTGTVLATRDITTSGELAIAGGLLWLAPGRVSGPSVTLHGLDLQTLTPAATIRLPVAATKNDPVTLAPSTAGDRIFLAVGGTITALDPTTRRVLARYAAPGKPVASLDPAPGGNRLYVGWNVHGGPLQLAVLDPATGALLDHVHLPAGMYGAVQTASAGGVWLWMRAGMQGTLTFHPAADLTRSSPAVAFSGGGWVATAAVGGDTVWIGGDDAVACADPSTGRIRSTATIRGPGDGNRNIAFVTEAGHTLFASYSGAHAEEVLVELHPPARCRG